MSATTLPDGTSPDLTVPSGTTPHGGADAGPATATAAPPARRITAPTMGTERDFERAVVDLAHACGWKAAHFRPARTVHGWRTAVGYDGAGFPDLVLVHPLRGLHWYRELKVGNAKLSDEQSAWKSWLISAGANFDTWRPRDWADIVAALSNGQARAS